VVNNSLEIDTVAILPGCGPAVDSHEVSNEPSGFHKYGKRLDYLKNSIFWDTMLSTESRSSFRRNMSPPYSNWRINQTRNQHETDRKRSPVCFISQYMQLFITSAERTSNPMPCLSQQLPPSQEELHHGVSYIFRESPFKELFIYWTVQRSGMW
jgi:hypothetical protein